MRTTAIQRGLGDISDFPPGNSVNYLHLFTSAARNQLVITGQMRQFCSVFSYNCVIIADIDRKWACIHTFADGFF